LKRLCPGESRQDRVRSFVQTKAPA
jgi:hypothetical protein